MKRSGEPVDVKAASPRIRAPVFVPPLRAIEAIAYEVGYHNPFGGSPEHPFYPPGAPAIQGVNAVVAGFSPASGRTSGSVSQV